MRAQNHGTIPGESIWNRHGLYVRAVPNELGRPIADRQFTDTRETGGFPSEPSCNGADVASAENLQSLEVGQLDQKVDELGH